MTSPLNDTFKSRGAIVALTGCLVVVLGIILGIVGGKNNDLIAVISFVFVGLGSVVTLVVSFRGMRSHWVYAALAVIVSTYLAWLAWKLCAWFWGNFPD